MQATAFPYDDTFKADNLAWSNCPQEHKLISPALRGSNIHSLLPQICTSEDCGMIA